MGLQKCLFIRILKICLAKVYRNGSNLNKRPLIYVEVFARFSKQLISVDGTALFIKRWQQTCNLRNSAMNAVRASEFRCGLWMTVNTPNSWHAGVIIRWPSFFAFLKKNFTQERNLFNWQVMLVCCQLLVCKRRRATTLASGVTMHHVARGFLF